MLAIETEDEEERMGSALHPAAAFRLPQFARALACTLLVPAAIYLLTFVAARSHGLSLRDLGLNKFGPVLDYGYEAKQLNADVVIFGDSSAFLGVDPRVVNRTLRHRTVVLPDTIGSLPVTGDMVLRRYLANNRRPSTLVLYFSPWNLNYNGSQKKEFLLEGEEEMIRYGSWHDIWQAFTRYPAEFLTFPFNELEPLGLKHIREALHHQGAERGPETIKGFGHWDYTLPYAALDDDCKLRPEYIKAMPHDTVLMLKKRYEAEGMRVVVYLAPIPNCGNAIPVIAHSYADVAAAKPLLLPPGWFANDSFTAHVRPEHVLQTSQLFANGLTQLLAPYAGSQ